jgi:hypothetical protein
MAITKLSIKDPAETILISFDFTNMFLDDLEVITAATWSVEVITGTDASPNILSLGNPTFANAIASQLITGGVAGCTYLIKVLATTSKSQILKLSASLPVLTQ